ncbi:MAG: GNAT family N-acetyltransferase [Planctomycetes bacterium]|nr:GNAT family N-acetyltransferase [Planctomycetota bacterium]
MEILAAVPADVEEILDVQKAAFLRQAEIYSNHDLPPLLETADEVRSAFGEWTVLKAVENGRLVGSARGRSRDDGACFIARVSVHPDCQGRGIGGALMAALENAFPRATCFELFTGAKSVGNIAFYGKLGYVVYAEEDRGDITIVKMRKTPE